MPQRPQRKHLKLHLRHRQRRRQRRKWQLQVRKAAQSAPRGRTFTILTAAVNATERGAPGGAGPALTHIASQYPPAQLTALLKAPTAKMQAAGMVALTLDAADMTALVSYLTGLGGASAASAAAPTPSGASSPAPAAKASPAAPNPVAKVASQPPMNKLESTGKSVFKLHRCADCHGTGGAAGTAAASALAGAGKSVTPASLTTMLQHPTVKMREGGMPPVSLGSGELKALVAYLSYISASKSSPQ